MTARDELIAKIRRLPEPIVQQVNDYVDFLLTKRGGQGMRRLQTLTGKPFEYEGKLIEGITAYAGKSRTRIVITADTIEKVRSAIGDNRDGILMGANRTSPSPNSLGTMLQRERQNPQQLSYLIPLLKEDEFCDAFQEKKKGRPFLVKFTENV